MWKLTPPTLILLLFSSCASLWSSAPEVPTPEAVIAALVDGALEVPPIGSYSRVVSGASPEAQGWFDQGLRYTYGFNQDQAAACFARAAQASPECPMAWWGLAYIFGIDINNASVSSGEALWAHAASLEAQRLAPLASPAEQALIQAVAARSPAVVPSGDERKPLDEAYLAAMRLGMIAAPDDPDVGTLLADAMMLLQPWEYWTWDGKPLHRSEEIVTVLEAVIAAHPNHPGANHFYIHVVESSSDPALGIPSADRLGGLMPGSGHLVHMPSHIYANVGRYQDAFEVNVKAAELDEAYFESYTKGTGYSFYYLHNLHFVAYAAMMEGQSELAQEYVQRMEARIPEAQLKELAPGVDGLFAIHIHGLMRFGLWDEMLALPEYPEFRLASRAMRRFGRTVALANLGRAEEARAELAAFDEACEEVPEEWSISYNPAHSIFKLAREYAEAEVRWREGDATSAIAQLQAATILEQELVYTEPPAWCTPVRHAIGAIQLASGDPKGAEKTYREDLQRLPNNAWSLLGLQQALVQLERVEDAEAMQSKLDHAWARADVKPPASCYCGVELMDAAP